MPSFRGSSQPRDQIQVSCIGKQVLYHQCQLGSPMKHKIYEKDTEKKLLMGKTGQVL